MEIIDAYGDMVSSLPDSARCRLTGENPEHMMKCPSDEFDGDCCPEMCDYYTED